MEYLFSINAEGSPLLCLDARAAESWKGSEDGAPDYDNLCAEIGTCSEFSAIVRQIGGQRSAVWEMGGAGTADVFLRHDGAVVVVRAWLAENTDRELIKVAIGNPDYRLEMGTIDVPSGILAVLWAPESGERIPQELDTGVVRVPGTAVRDSVFALKLPNVCFDSYDERVYIGMSEARRLTLIPRSL